MTTISCKIHEFDATTPNMSQHVVIGWPNACNMGSSLEHFGHAIKAESKQKGCLHDIGATFIPARAHSGSLLWLCIRLHDTNTKCHAGASHTGASSPRFLCQSEIFIPARKFIPVSCKRGITVRFISILDCSQSPILP